MKNNNILIVGSGNICDMMLKYGVNQGNNIQCIPLRQLDKYVKENDLEKYALIVYTGYDHFSILNNIIYLKKIIKKIINEDWVGNFIFLNSQSVIESEISISEFKSYDKWIPNRYVLTKKWQAKIIEKTKINYINYIIPIVTGDGTAQDKQLRSIASSDCIKIPNGGRNYFYFIEINKLMSEILNNIEVSKYKNRKSFFIYSGYSSLNDKLYYDYNGKKIYKSTEAKNSYNLPRLELIKYMQNKVIRSYIAIIIYTFVKGILSKADNANGLNKKKLSSEEHNFYSRSFNSPDQIKNISIIKL